MWGWLRHNRNDAAPPLSGIFLIMTFSNTDIEPFICDDRVHHTILLPATIYFLGNIELFLPPKSSYRRHNPLSFTSLIYLVSPLS